MTVSRLTVPSRARRAEDVRSTKVRRLTEKTGERWDKSAMFPKTLVLPWEP